MMKRFLNFLTATVPYFAAETIQSAVIYSLMMAVKTTSQGMLYLFSVTAAVISAILFFFWYRYEIRYEKKGSLRTLFSINNMILFLILGIGCQFFFTGLVSLIAPLFSNLFNDYSSVISTIRSGNLGLVLFLMLAAAPVAEELIFRGVTLHMANRYISFYGANILQAVLFGLYHGNVIQGIYAGCLGFLLGGIYLKYRTILAPILLHAIINGSSFFTYLLPGGRAIYCVILIAGGCLMAIVLAYLKPFPRFSAITGNDFNL